MIDGIWREVYLERFVEGYMQRHPDVTKRYARRQGRLRLATARKKMLKLGHAGKTKDGGKSSRVAR